MARKRYKGQVVVPVDRAIALYNKLGSWSKVAKELKRPNGTRFTAHGIWSAVRWKDKGNPGFRNARLLGYASGGSPATRYPKQRPDRSSLSGESVRPTLSEAA